MTQTKLWDYLKLIATQMEKAHEKNDTEEVMRLAALARDTLDDALSIHLSHSADGVQEPN